MDKIEKLKSKLAHDDFENGGSALSFRNGWQAAMELQFLFMKWVCDGEKIDLVDGDWYWKEDEEGGNPLTEKYLFDYWLSNIYQPE